MAGLSAVFCEVGVAHVACFVEGVVKFEGCGECVGCLAALAELEVVEEQALVIGVGTVLDDAVGALHGVETAEVGDTLVGDDDVDGVLGVVAVGHDGHDVGDESAFGH